MGWSKTAKGWAQFTAAILGILVTLGSVAFAVDSRYAHAGDITHVVETVKNLRCDVISSQLDELLLKKEHGELREYEKIRLQQLKREWQRVCNTSRRVVHGRHISTLALWVRTTADS